MVTVVVVTVYWACDQFQDLHGFGPVDRKCPRDPTPNSRTSILVKS